MKSDYEKKLFELGNALSDLNLDRLPNYLDDINGQIRDIYKRRYEIGDSDIKIFLCLNKKNDPALRAYALLWLEEYWIVHTTLLTTLDGDANPLDDIFKLERRHRDNDPKKSAWKDFPTESPL